MTDAPPLDRAPSARPPAARHALPDPHLRRPPGRRRRDHRPPLRLGPPPPRPRPADLPRPPRPPRDHPGRHRPGRRPGRPRDRQPRPQRVRRHASTATSRARLPGTENPRLPTGAIELRAATSGSSASRRRRRSTSTSRTRRSTSRSASSYRYLDIRREAMARRLLLRSRLVQAIREVHHAHGFVEVETPNLIKSTPEGARDFVVPSRLQPGSVYALPQSPQQLKQLLMVAGVDRYFQIARCFRDEDLRGDRQPEFTQLDLEMSFVDEDAVMAFVEAMVDRGLPGGDPGPADRRRCRSRGSPTTRRWSGSAATSRTCGSRWSSSTSRRLWAEAPHPASASSTTRWRAAAGSRRSSRPGMGGATRKEIDELTERAKRFGAKGLVWLAVDEAGAVRVVDREVPRRRRRRAARRPGPGRTPATWSSSSPTSRGVTADVLGRLRAELGVRARPGRSRASSSFCWVHRFPMYQWDAESGRWDATHNPFSGVVPEDEALLTTASRRPLEARSERSGRPRPGAPVRHRRSTAGSSAAAPIRIHRRDLLARSFALQGQTEEGMKEKFGALLEAFEYGPPPHGGIALGIDRWAALLAHQSNIREVMAFPKTQSGARPDARGAVAARSGPVRGARAPLRRRARPADAGADRRLTDDDRSGGPRAPARCGPATRRARRPSSRGRRRRATCERRATPSSSSRCSRSRSTPACSAAAFAGDELVGVVLPELKVAVVRPEHRRRGIGRRLIDLAAGDGGGAGPAGALHGQRPGRRRPAAAFLRATGFAFHSTVWDLELPPDRPVPPPVWPDGVVARSFDRSRDVDDAGAARQRRVRRPPDPAWSWRRSWSAARSTTRTSSTTTRSSSRTPRRARLVGFCLADRPPGRRPDRLDRRRDRDGRRPAGPAGPRARAAAAPGRRGVPARAPVVPNVSLAVNGRNEGALGLYESEGFVRARTRDRWSRPVAAS